MVKRGNGEGSIRKIGNSWVAKTQIGWLDNGHPKIKSFSAPTRNAALKRMRDYKNELEHNEGISEGDTTIYEGLIYWLENFKSMELKESSYTRLETTINSSIEPYIGHYMVKEITTGTIQTELINRLYDEGKSYSTIKKSYHAMNAYYKKLFAMGEIKRNPMLGVTLPSSKHFDTKEIKILTDEEIAHFKKKAMSKCTTNDKYRYRYGLIFVFMMYTGLRCGEALGLQWKHIDIENKQLTVCQSVVTVKNKNNDTDTKYTTRLQKSTKTISGTRKIPLCNQALEAIKKYKELYYSGDENSFVVTTDKGNLLRTRHFERSVNYIYNSAGIDASGLHILRHTFASMLFKKNIDIKIISKILGHSDVSTTYNIYIHLTQEQEQMAIQELNDL